MTEDLIALLFMLLIFAGFACLLMFPVQTTMAVLVFTIIILAILGTGHDTGA